VAPAVRADRQTPPAAAKPIVVFETERGTFEIEFFSADAPKSVAHLMALFKQGFYRGLRFHRVEASLVQIGDPQTRNARNEAAWGTGNSGTPIGVAEISKTRKHVRGSVGLANNSDPRYADSQFYIMKVASPSLDGKYAVVGQVIKGMEVVDKIQRPDVLKNATIKAAAPK
jgi:cyclophilin family peptidyl-prolyl cis-trans isomerase